MTGFVDVEPFVSARSMQPQIEPDQRWSEEERSFLILPAACQKHDGYHPLEKLSAWFADFFLFMVRKHGSEGKL